MRIIVPKRMSICPKEYALSEIAERELCGRGGVAVAASAELWDVMRANDRVGPGGAIIVPPSAMANWRNLGRGYRYRERGAVTWSSNVSFSGKKLIGSGVGKTNVTINAGNIMTKHASQVTYLQGFSFTKTTGGEGSYAWTVQGTWPTGRPVIIEGCSHVINGSSLYLLQVAGGVVFAKCTFDAQWDDSIIKPKSIDKTGSKAKSSVSWSTDDTIGTNDNGEKNVYVEDCYLHGGGTQGMDCDDASRVTFRHNRSVFFSLNSHGLATSEVGARHIEVYNNQFWHGQSSGENAGSQLGNCNAANWMRGGLWVITDNFYDDYDGSGFWGLGKPELQADIRAQQDGSGTAYSDFADGRAYLSAGTGTYPRQHQLSMNWNSGVGTNSGYFVDPIYWWNNTGSGTSGSSPKDFGNGGSWGSNSPCFNVGRDIFFGTARPGYTKYTYPHPLRLTTGQAY